MSIESEEEGEVLPLKTHRKYDGTFIKGSCKLSLKFAYAFFHFFSSFPIKMLAMDAKAQKIGLGWNFFLTAENFTDLNVIDTT